MRSPVTPLRLLSGAAFLCLFVNAGIATAQLPGADPLPAAGFQPPVSLPAPLATQPPAPPPVLPLTTVAQPIPGMPAAPGTGPAPGIPQTLLRTTPTPAAPPTPGTVPEASPKSALDNPLEALKAVTEPQAPVPAVSPAILGTDRKLNVTWDDGGFRFRSADGGFNIHLGGRLMSDEIWWSQSPQLRQPPTLPANSPLVNRTGVGQGIGDLQDGFFVRRARFVADGSIFKNIDFKVEFDFENYNSIAFDESYVGMRNVPYIGMIRFGQTHVPFGLEAYTSSRFLPLMERSPVFDAFYQEFAPGIFTNTTWLDNRITMQHMFHKIDNFQQFNGASFGDGKYAYSGRVSALPVYEDDGRELIHLGIAYQWRKGSPPQDFNGGTTLPSNPNPAVTTNTDLIRFRARPGLRDVIGVQGDGTRAVDTGNIIGDNVQSVNGEFMLYRGPFWVQSEINYSQVANAVYPAANTATPRGDLGFWGGYVQAGYFLTGESRGYDKPMGKYGRVVPKTNFYLIRDDCGQIRSGPGAWELVYRYGYVNLNDNFVLGGTYSEHTVGVNWYWNANIKFQANYINGFRSVPTGTTSGTIHGFGIRGALEF